MEGGLADAGLQPAEEGVVGGVVVLPALEAEAAAGGDVCGQIVDVDGGRRVEAVGVDRVLVDRVVSFLATERGRGCPLPPPGYVLFPMATV